MARLLCSAPVHPLRSTPPEAVVSPLAAAAAATVRSCRQSLSVSCLARRQRRFPRAAVMLLLVVTLALCSAPACARLCPEGTYWTSEPGSDLCSPCSRCGPGLLAVRPCSPLSDTLCARQAPPSDEQVHRDRLEEERLRLQLERAGAAMQVERTRLETLVFEWQTTVFVVAILVTFALVLSFLALLLRRSRAVVKKGVEDYSHLLLKRPDEACDGHDQGSLAFADLGAIRIGRRAFDSPYSDLSEPRPAGSTTRAVGVPM